MQRVSRLGSRPMRILVIASEVVPFSKTGGLADVAGALPKHLQKLGHEVRVITPRYKCVEDKRDISQLDTKLKITLKIGQNWRTAGLWRAGMKSIDGGEDDIPVNLLDQKEYYCRQELYAERGIDYPDNDNRFAFFSRASLEALRLLQWQPDIIHCQDWQTGLVPVFVRQLYGAEMPQTKVVFTFHNANFWGPTGRPRDFLSSVGLTEDLFQPDKLEFYNQVSFLKGGLVFADAVNTVSPTYADEVQGAGLTAGDRYDYGARLTGLYRHLAGQGRLGGIINGLDYDVWNPATDNYLPIKFDLTDVVEGKKQNKQALQRELGLETNSDLPLLGGVGRIDMGQKGLGLLLQNIDELAKSAQVVLLGSGDPTIEDLFTQKAQRHPGRVLFKKGFNDPLAHQIYASTDFFLMPSQYEPCGLAQMIALRYGSIPIVRRTGGLADTMRDIGQDAGRGNGFVFEQYSAETFFAAIRRALAYRASAGERFRDLIARGIQIRFSWENSAKEYEELFTRVLSGQRPF